MSLKIFFYNIYTKKLVNETFNKFNLDLYVIYDELNITTNKSLENENEYFLFNNENFDNPIKEIYNNFYNFTELFEEEINNTFMKEECEIVNIENKCKEIKFKSKLNYSEYNFNVIKLRNALYYTKNTVKDLYDLFENFNFDDIIDYNIIYLSDKNINDKNILQIYNESFQKIKYINKETDELLKPAYDYFIEDISKKFTYERDYLPFIELFIKILPYFP